jgi:hypothetical protein
LAIALIKDWINIWRFSMLPETAGTVIANARIFCGPSGLAIPWGNLALKRGKRRLLAGAWSRLAESMA